MKTSNLSGVVLDWAVADIQRLNYRIKEKDDLSKQIVILEVTSCPDNKPGCCVVHYKGNYFSPSTNWSQGGPIIEREEIDVCHSKSLGAWVAAKQIFDECMAEEAPFYGAWALQAAMRCYVSSKLGDEIDIPEELK